jgi:Zn-finger nucleic acid-binding protein
VPTLQESDVGHRLGDVDHCVQCRGTWFDEGDLRELSQEAAGHGAWLDGRNTRALLRLIADGRMSEIEERARAAAQEDAARRTASIEAAWRDRAWRAQNGLSLRRPTTLSMWTVIRAIIDIALD